MFECADHRPCHFMYRVWSFEPCQAVVVYIIVQRSLEQCEPDPEHGLRCAGCVFKDFGGQRVLHLEHGANLSAVNCAFENNTVFKDSSGGAVIQADAPVDGLTALRLQGCTFSGNTPDATPVA